MNKTNLKGLTLPEMEIFIETLGERSYRAQQIFKWIYGSGVTSFDEMTNLSKDLRHKLSEKATISNLKLVTARESKQDKTVKFLFQLEDGLNIESVLMFEGERTTLCISTQVGCAIDCKFCATGMMGLQRHLSAGEITDQLLTIQKLTSCKVTNLVCMGMGEPFHNYVNVINACDLMTDVLGPNLAKRHIVVSTSGLVPKIYQFTDEQHKYRLAISLNATTDDVRSRIIPINKKWPIARLFEATRYYTEKSGERITFEYVLLKNVNDTLEDAERLKRLVSGMFCKVNLIPYNSTFGNFTRPSENRVMSFYEKMASLNVPVTIRWSKGDDIEAGCGQLAVINQP